MNRPRKSCRAEVHGAAAPAELQRLTNAPGTVTVDARGTWCPEPLLRLQRAAANTAPGIVIALVADDPGVELDVPAWCISSGNEYLGTLRRGRDLVSLARRREMAPADQPKR